MSRTPNQLIVAELPVHANHFTFKPKLSSQSLKLASNLEDDFLTRQQKHADKQKKCIEESMATLYRTGAVYGSTKDKVTQPISRKNSRPEDDGSKDESQNSQEKENEKRILSKRGKLEGRTLRTIDKLVNSQQSPEQHQKRPTRTRVTKSMGCDTDDDDDSPSPQQRLVRSRTMPGLSRSEAAAISLDRLHRAKDVVDRALKDKKVFCIHGRYRVLREILRERGWVEQFQTVTPKPVKKPKPKLAVTTDDSGDDDDDDDGTDDDGDPNEVPPWLEENGIYGVMSRMVKGATPTLIWSTKNSSIDFKSLQKDQIVNHFAKGAALTTKNGLCTNLRLVTWYEPIDPSSFFPRCYKLSTEEEKHEFIDDYRLTACMSVLKWYQATYSPTSLAEPLAQTPDAPPSEVVHSPNVTPRSAAPPPEPRPTRPTKRVTSSVIVPLEVLTIATKQVELFLQDSEHLFLDMTVDPMALPPEKWDVFIGWYYQLCHGNGKLRDHALKLEEIGALLTRLEALWPQYQLDGMSNVWIVKPGAKSRGRGITCHNKLEDILKFVASTLTREGKFVVQKYIERPLLVHQTKFDIRQWFVVTDWNPLTMYFYKSSYLRFCSQNFTLHDFNEAIHLSNNAIQANYDNSAERSTELPQENMWYSDEFRSHLNSLGQYDVWDDKIYPGMKHAIILALQSVQDSVDARKNSFELFGADFMLTEDFTPWLIEVNCSPCLAPSTAVTKDLTRRVIDDTLKIVCDRRFNKYADIGRFEMAYKQPTVNVPSFKGQNLIVEGLCFGKKIKEPQKVTPQLNVMSRVQQHNAGVAQSHERLQQERAQERLSLAREVYDAAPPKRPHKKVVEKEERIALAPNQYYPHTLDNGVIKVKQLPNVDHQAALDDDVGRENCTTDSSSSGPSSPCAPPPPYSRPGSCRGAAATPELRADLDPAAGPLGAPLLTYTHNGPPDVIEEESEGLSSRPRTAPASRPASNHTMFKAPIQPKLKVTPYNGPLHVSAGAMPTGEGNNYYVSPAARIKAVYKAYYASGVIQRPLLDYSHRYIPGGIFPGFAPPTNSKRNYKLRRTKLSFMGATGKRF